MRRLFAACLVWTCSAQAFAQGVSNDPPDDLSSETNEQLKPASAVDAAPSAFAPSAPSAPEPMLSEELENRLLDLEDRLDLVERQTVLDSVRFTAEYRMILNSVRYRGPTPDPYDRLSPFAASTREIETTGAEIWAHRVRLNLSAEPLPSLRLTGRLTMYKLFGSSQGPAFVQDSSSTRVPRDAALRFDTIWIDWFATDWLAISGGRIAYAGGNPGELKENSSTRAATWGLQMVDGEYDTLNVTVSPHETFHVRGFYASWFNPNTSDVFGGLPFVSSGTDNLRIVGGNVELEVPSLGQNFFQLGFYYVPKFRPFSVPIPDPGFDPSSDYTHAPAPLNGSLLFPAEMPSSLGTYANASALMQFYDLGGSGLDLFAAGSIGFLSSNGNAIAYDVPAGPGTTDRVRAPVLFLSSTRDSGLTWFYFVGARYRLPIDALRNPKIGFEMNRGSRYHVSFTAPTDNLLTKLATRGYAYEAYVIFPVNEHLFFRASYLHVDQRFASGFFGPNPDQFGSTAPPTSARIHALSFVLDARL
ncbi:MAG: DUF3373 family protein [Sandaracinus sp.]|nr:DUF3373 family protein [Sandaracinus sp.]MCB9617910.1 DUF3373 family protein [Sandaracinus sp.]MCB9623693.1 DUF3373 family protein [Sandaracinus sp.]MCB9634487.1 DUF3373 family protein [Sandaracinus sp.]